VRRRVDRRSSVGHIGSGKAENGPDGGGEQFGSGRSSTSTDKRVLSTQNDRSHRDGCRRGALRYATIRVGVFGLCICVYKRIGVNKNTSNQTDASFGHHVVKMYNPTQVGLLSS
jgi:hypothetical protein